jgi:hypothetical protein
MTATDGILVDAAYVSSTKQSATGEHLREVLGWHRRGGASLLRGLVGVCLETDEYRNFNIFSPAGTRRMICDKLDRMPT